MKVFPFFCVRNPDSRQWPGLNFFDFFLVRGPRYCPIPTGTGCDWHPAHAHSDRTESSRNSVNQISLKMMSVSAVVVVLMVSLEVIDLPAPDYSLSTRYPDSTSAITR